MKSYFKTNPAFEKAANPATFIAMILLVVLVWFNYRDLVYDKSDDESKRGQIGDSYGGLNTLFTGLAFAGLCYSIVIQKRDAHKLQVEEALRKESELQQKAESDFFQLLRILNELVSGLRLTKEIQGGGVSLHSTHYEGRQIFQYLWKNSVMSTFPKADVPNPAEYAAIQYGAHRKDYGYVLSPYFRTLYHVLKHIDESEVEEPKRYRFAKLLRAQMNEVQAAYLLFNCLFPENSKLARLALKYSLFKYISNDLIPVSNFKSILESVSAVAKSNDS